MSLRTCPSCDHPVLNLWRFFLDPGVIRKPFHCTGCNNALLFTPRFWGELAGLAVAVGVFVLPAVLVRRPSGEIPLLVGVAVILASWFSFVAMRYCVGAWTIADVRSGKSLKRYLLVSKCVAAMMVAALVVHEWVTSSPNQRQTAWVLTFMLAVVIGALLFEERRSRRGDARTQR